MLSRDAKLTASWAQVDELAKLGFLPIEQVRIFSIFILRKWCFLKIKKMLLDPLIFKGKLESGFLFKTWFLSINN